MSESREDSPNVIRIKDLVLDKATRRVTRGNKVLKLGGLTFDLLLVLAERAPALVKYEQIAERVWKGRSVSPETIAQRAKMLRDALSDDARSPRYFELIRGQGYRLLADVERLPDSTRAQARRRWPLIVAGLSVVAALGLSINAFMQKPAAPESVAVLPFADLSPQADQKYLADGIAEELINQLTGLEGLDVASRTESFFYERPAHDLQEIGKALGVSAILEGSVRKSGDELRITVQLIDVASGYHLWSANFDRRLQDIFAVQQDIARSVAGALGVKLGVGGINEFTGAGTESFEAYEAYLRRDFEKAIALDPDYAAAWAGQGLVIASTMHENAPEDAPAIIERAYQHVAKAIELNPESAIAHAHFATLIYATMDWDTAQRSFARSLSMRRSDNNVGHYANMLMRAGRSRLSLQHHQEREAMLRIGQWPHLLRINVDIALNDLVASRQKAAGLPDNHQAFVNLLITLNDGSADEVRAAIEKLPKSSADYQELFGPVQDLLASPEDAIVILRELADDPDRVWPFKYHNIALMSAYLGYPEFAFDVLHRELQYTTIRFGALWYPVMADVRKLPAFKQFVTDVNLVDYWRTYGWADFCRPLGEKDFTCE